MRWSDDDRMIIVGLIYLQFIHVTLWLLMQHEQQCHCSLCSDPPAVLLSTLHCIAGDEQQRGNISLTHVLSSIVRWSAHRARARTNDHSVILSENVIVPAPIIVIAERSNMMISSQFWTDFLSSSELALRFVLRCIAALHIGVVWCGGVVPYECLACLPACLPACLIFLRCFRDDGRVFCFEAFH